MNIASPGQVGDDAPYAPAERLRAVAGALAERYRVEGEIGRGGMATVYLAEDLRHRRRVAVKVLRPELGAALGAERFLREIAVTAALQHPHVLPLHDSGEAGELLYYVMPYVEGESLRDRLARERQLPVEDAVRVACDVAGALDYAHRHGVVHRDVKPENVLLHDGRAVVADFGIARAVQRAADADSLTGTGISIGTPGYMSPEQVAGDKELDGRSDVFSLGCVLYEMLVGAPPFVAATAQGVLAKVMTEDPRPVTDERRAVPAHVAAAVMRALEKLPADRFATAAQLAAALAAPAGAPAGVPRAAPAGAPTAGRPTGRDLRWAAFAVALAAVAVAAFAAATRRPGGAGVSRAGPVRFTLAIADSQRVSAAPRPVAISPDGRTVVYAGAAGPGRRMLYARPLDQLAARAIPGTVDAVGPFFSPDGRWIAFTDDRAGQLKKVPVGGGTVVAIGDLPAGVSGRTWGPGDVIVVGGTEGLSRIPASGGALERLTAADTARREIRHSDPLFLPDGKTVAFRIAVAGDAETTRMGLVSLDARASADGRPARHTTLDVRGGTPLGYAEGQLVVGHPDGTVSATAVDYRRGRVLGSPVPLLDDVAYFRASSAALAPNGSLVYVRGAPGARLAIVDERGAVVGGRDEPRRYQRPRWSPDGRRIALEIVTPEAATGDIWVYDVPSGVLSRLTFRGSASFPVWTPDGKRVAYTTRNGEQTAELWWVPADRSGPEERLHAMPAGLGAGEVEFAPDGRHAVLRAGSGPPRTNDLWLLPLDGARPATRLLQTPHSEAMPRISPDGRWLAYVSDETGQYEVYVRPFPGPGGRVQVSAGGGAEPVWARDGRGLFFRAGGQFVATTLTVSPASDAGAPTVTVADRRVLFEDRYRSTLPAIGSAFYDADRDGRRFAVVQPTSEDREVVVVLDWLAEVRARVAAAGRR